MCAQAEKHISLQSKTNETDDSSEVCHASLVGQVKLPLTSYAPRWSF